MVPASLDKVYPAHEVSSGVTVPSWAVFAEPESVPWEEAGIEGELQGILEKHNVLRQRNGDLERERGDLEEQVEEVRREKEQVEKTLGEVLEREQGLVGDVLRLNREKETANQEHNALGEFVQNIRKRLGFQGGVLPPSQRDSLLSDLTRALEEQLDKAKQFDKLMEKLKAEYKSGSMPQEYVVMAQPRGEKVVEAPPGSSSSPLPGTSKQAQRELQREKDARYPHFTVAEVKQEEDVKKQVKYIVACNQYRSYSCPKCAASNKVSTYKYLSGWESHMREVHGREFSNKEIREERQVFQQVPLSQRQQPGDAAAAPQSDPPHPPEQGLPQKLPGSGPPPDNDLDDDDDDEPAIKKRRKDQDAVLEPTQDQPWSPKKKEGKVGRFHAILSYHVRNAPQSQYSQQKAQQYWEIVQALSDGSEESEDEQ